MKGLAVAVLTLALLGHHQATAQPTDDFTALEATWNQAHLQGDAPALDHLWADNIVVIVPKMPPFNKQQALGVFRAGRMKFLLYSTSDLVVRRYDRCVVVTGRLQRSRSMGERVLDDDWRFTKVYVRGANGWHVATFHASEAGQ